MAGAAKQSIGRISGSMDCFVALLLAMTTNGATFWLQYESAGQLGKVQLFSSLVAAITSRSSSGPGTGGLELKMSHWFFILSAGSGASGDISCISWWSQPRK